MLKSLLRATVFASSLALAGGALLTPAFAEVVYNRGSAAELEIRRSAQDIDGL